MVAFNFKQQFANDVARGRKRMTIRATNRCQAGDPLQLYTGMRTKACKKLRDAVCAYAAPVEIDSDAHGRLRVSINGTALRGKQLDQLVTADGFTRRMDMRDFFDEHYGLPFRGWLIRW